MPLAVASRGSFAVVVVRSAGEHLLDAAAAGNLTAVGTKSTPRSRWLAPAARPALHQSAEAARPPRAAVTRRLLRRRRDDHGVDGLHVHASWVAVRDIRREVAGERRRGSVGAVSREQRSSKPSRALVARPTSALRAFTAPQIPLARAAADRRASRRASRKIGDQPIRGRPTPLAQGNRTALPPGGAVDLVARDGPMDHRDVRAAVETGPRTMVLCCPCARPRTPSVRSGSDAPHRPLR